MSNKTSKTKKEINKKIKKESILKVGTMVFMDPGDYMDLEEYNQMWIILSLNYVTDSITYFSFVDNVVITDCNIEWYEDWAQRNPYC